MNNCYVLKKDTMTQYGLLKAGDVFEIMEGKDYYISRNEGGLICFRKDVVETNPGWFEKERWKPKNHENYFTLTLENDGIRTCCVCSWCGDSKDINRYNARLVFHTKEEAKEKVEKINKILSGEL